MGLSGNLSKRFASLHLHQRVAARAAQNVALRLLGENMAPQRAENLAAINQLLALIAAESPADYALFSTTRRTIDFSQFRPRGHYTQDESLKKYFQAMTWLGRTELMLTKPKIPGGVEPTEADVQRQTIVSFLLLEAAHIGIRNFFIAIRTIALKSIWLSPTCTPRQPTPPAI